MRPSCQVEQPSIAVPTARRKEQPAIVQQQACSTNSQPVNAFVRYLASRQKLARMTTCRQRGIETATASVPRPDLERHAGIKEGSAQCMQDVSTSSSAAAKYQCYWYYALLPSPSGLGRPIEICYREYVTSPGHEVRVGMVFPL